MKRNIFSINMIMCLIWMVGCHTDEFKHEVYKKQLEVFNIQVFKPIAMAMERKSQKDPNKVKPYLNFANQIDSLSNEFFNEYFLKGDLENTIKKYEKLKLKSIEMLSEKYLFLPSERDYFVKQVSDSVPVDNFDKLFTNCLKIKCLTLRRCLAAVESSDCFGGYSLLYDTIKTNGANHLLHITDRYSYAKEFTKVEIKEFSKNGKSLIPRADLEKIYYFSLYAPCDEDTGAIVLKVELQKSIEMISESNLKIDLNFSYHGK